MRIYQFHFYNPRGAYPALDFVDCTDDGEAGRQAFSQLRQHRTCNGVDVFDGDRHVARLERPRLSTGSRPEAPRHPA